MHKHLRPAVVGLAMLLVVAGARTLGAQGTTSRNGVPPLIDRELLFGDPEITGAQISPDGAFIAFIKPYKGTRNVWVKRTEQAFDAARPITADTRRPIPAFFWSRDGKFILFVQDQLGDENFNVFAVNPADAPPSGTDVPVARNLTAAKGVRAAIYAVPKTDPDALYVGLNDRDAAWHDLYKVRISSGERTLLRQNTERMTGWVFDLKGQLRLATRSAENGDTEILRVDPNGFAKIYSCNVFETCGPGRFHKDGRRVYMVTNKGTGDDFVRLTLLDVQTGTEELVESDPQKRVDLAAPLFSEKTDELIGTVYVDDRPRIHWRDKSRQAEYEMLRQKFPGREVGFGSSTTDERLVMVTVRSDVEPGETHLFDRQTKQLRLQYRIRERLARENLAPMTTVRYKSSDGLEIPAYLTLPKGVAAKNLPVVIVPHGGPWARDAWGYDPMAQFLANRGYGVLQPNFRGSTGYGKKFLDAGNKQWGEKMQDDVTWGVRYLIDQGIADPKRVGIFGGSYGGYATLAGLAFTPDLYAAGVSLVGPSSLITLLESIPPYWEAGRKMFHERMGDPSTPEGRTQLERQSPLHSASKIKAPLLVIQGANDPRVKKAESEQIVIALRDRGFPVQYLLAPDEGHGFARPVNNMAAFAAAEAFLAQHLEGRFQDGGTREVTERLRELTVDPKTVEKPRAVSLASQTPKPAVDLQPGTINVLSKIQMGAQTMEIPTSTTVTSDGDSWIITETVKTPAGEATDRTVVAKGSLVVRSRSVSQGPVNIDLKVADGKMSGEMKMGGQAKPVSADLGGELFADGAGAALVLATLPLADGYTTTFRNFNLLTQRTRAMQLTVNGSEQVTVPAGSFDTFRVDVASPDDGTKLTLWVSKSSRQVVRSTVSSPQLPGGTVTSELLK
jgi:dipeptidyl aminopeptidase/acylaminoacyl peptidase